ncbi:hypothetical protein LCGC14_2854060 [marine sediment metagenome]|uniref:Uncharacterized protein n=1 Tax=marine sediment metagenome TaxID=412755 RepID=A0A0F9AYJ3_9ZZZZ
MKYFEVNDTDGDPYLDLVREWPQKLTKERALQLSIRKWEFIVDAGAKFPDDGGLTCALCELYAEIPNCMGCPVAEFVEQPGCIGTPYGNYMRGYTLEAATKELAFLKEVYLAKYGEEYP